jgi:DNA helicase II / ATP-dependent DNA helicase PcrA
LAKISFDTVRMPNTSRGLPRYDFGHEPSVMQLGFYEWVYSGNGSAVLIAVAGSGKSTSIVNSIMFIEPHEFVTILAFNTTIAEEMRTKIKDLGTRLNRSMQRVQAKTFHSLGYSAVLKYINKKYDEVKPEGNKCRKLIEQEFGVEFHKLYGSFCRRLISIGKGSGIGCLLPNTEEQWQEIINHHDLSLDSDEANEQDAIACAQLVLEKSNQVALDGWLDYDDQIYLPVLWNLKLWQNDFVFIDEAQDTNAIRRALARKALKQNGRLIAVGDPNQAIYGFTGASHDAIDLIQRDFDSIKLPLTVSYRCPKIAEYLVAEMVPHFTVYEKAPHGEDIHLNLKGALKRLTDRDAVLCRNTAPLIELAFSIIATGRGCKVLGREIGEGLLRLIDLQKAKTIDGLIEKLEAYKEREVTRLLEKKEESKAEALSDRVDCVFTIIKRLTENKRTIMALTSQIISMFSDDDGRPVLILSTIHKAKGREWDNVAVLKPELSPSKWARQKHQYQQELNLMYVRDTRFKKTRIVLIQGGET